MGDKIIKELKRIGSDLFVIFSIATILVMAVVAPFIIGVWF